MLTRLTRTAPAFWGRPPGLLADLLLPIGAAWDATGRMRRAFARSYCAAVPVVCIGNLVAGGAGKTPVALALGIWLKEHGVSAHVVTRGYGGDLRGPLRVDPDRHDSLAVGDEALMLAARLPCWIASHRAAGVGAAIADGAPAILLDDGFQDPAVGKTLALIVVDAEYGFGNGRVIPAGPLRENLRSGLARADAIVMLTAQAEADGPAQLGAIARIPVIGAVLAPVAGERLAGERLLAFAGIGRPEKFFTMLRSLGAILVGVQAFPDHHPFRAAEIDMLRRNAARLDAGLITTRKDIVRLPPEGRAGIDVLDAEIRWRDPAAVARLMAPVLAQPAAMAATRQIESAAAAPAKVVRTPFVHRLQGWGAALSFGAFGLLPLDRASALGGALARRIGPSLGISVIARRNLKRAFPGLPEIEIEQIVGGMWDNLGRVAAEYPHLREIRVSSRAGGSRPTAWSISTEQSPRDGG